MPQAKLWYFELTADRLLVVKYAGGSDVLKRYKQPLGVVRTMELQEATNDLPAKLAQELVKVWHSLCMHNFNSTNYYCITKGNFKQMRQIIIQ